MESAHYVDFGEGKCERMLDSEIRKYSVIPDGLPGLNSPQSRVETQEVPKLGQRADSQSDPVTHVPNPATFRSWTQGEITDDNII